eukprot:gene8023-10131_t
MLVAVSGLCVACRPDGPQRLPRGWAPSMGLTLPGNPWELP